MKGNDGPYPEADLQIEAHRQGLNQLPGSLQVSRRPRAQPAIRSESGCREVAGNQWPTSPGAWIDPDAGKIALDAYANGWLAGRTNLRPSTRAKNRSLLDLHILPKLGSTSISQLSPSAVGSWHGNLRAAYPSTAAAAYRLLATILRTAVDDDLIPRSPCRVKGASSESAVERPTASVAELAAAVAANSSKVPSGGTPRWMVSTSTRPGPGPPTARHQPRGGIAHGRVPTCILVCPTMM